MVPTPRAASFWLILVHHFWLMHHVVDRHSNNPRNRIVSCLLSEDGFVWAWFYFSFLKLSLVAPCGPLLSWVALTKAFLLPLSVSLEIISKVCPPSVHCLSLSPKSVLPAEIPYLSPKFSLIHHRSFSQLGNLVGHFLPTPELFLLLTSLFLPYQSCTIF